jgi:hypothetical protein
MDRGLRRQCSSTRDGQGLLKVLVTEATMQETNGKEVSATSRTKGPQDRKTGWSGTPNRMVWFPRRKRQLLGSSTGSGCPRMGLPLMD